MPDFATYTVNTYSSVIYFIIVPFQTVFEGFFFVKSESMQYLKFKGDSKFFILGANI